MLQFPQHRENNVDSLVGGEIVRVSIIEDSSVAATNEQSTQSTSNSSSDDKKKRKNVFITVFCVAGTVAAALLVYRKIAQKRRVAVVRTTPCRRVALLRDHRLVVPPLDSFCHLIDRIQYTPLDLPSGLFL
jgi:hypothetical protein